MAPPTRSADSPFPRVDCGFNKAPPLIRMNAFQSKRKKYVLYSFLKRLSPMALAGLVCPQVLTSCQTRQIVSNEGAAKAASAAPLARTAHAPPRKALTPPLPKSYPAQSVASSIVPLDSEALLQEQVGNRLRTTFEVTREGSDVLFIQKSTKPALPVSLFEESIILGKVRACLHEASLHTPSSFHNGTASIAFPSSVKSGTASVLIAKILGLDGVESVRSTFEKSPN